MVGLTLTQNWNGQVDYRIWNYVDPFEMVKPLKTVWDSMEPRLRRYCADQAEQPIAFGIALQKVMKDARQVLNSEQCVDMAMENVLFMSKMDYDRKWLLVLDGLLVGICIKINLTKF